MIDPSLAIAPGAMAREGTVAPGGREPHQAPVRTLPRGRGKDWRVASGALFPVSSLNAPGAMAREGTVAPGGREPHQAPVRTLPRGRGKDWRVASGGLFPVSSLNGI